MSPLPPRRYVARLRAWRHSLIVRMGASLALVGVLATASGGALLAFVDASAGKAAAINLAGSLRMRSYGIGLALLDPSGDRPAQQVRLERAIQAFESRLHAPALADEIPGRADAPLRLAYGQLVSHWTRLRHQLVSLPPEQSRAAAMPAIEEFVAEADVLVALFQADLEGRIENYKMLGLAMLMLAIGVLASTVWYARSNLARPLADLQRCSRAIRAGDFSARVGQSGASEFDELANAFNAMAADLSGMYGALEDRVRDKTRALERSNRSLALLYDVAHRLSGPTPPREALVDVLSRLSSVIGVRSATLCTGIDSDVSGVHIATGVRSAGIDGRPTQARVQGVGAGALASDCASVCGTADCSTRCDEAGPTVALALDDGGQAQGTLTLRLASGQVLMPWQRELAETVARHVASALGATQRVQSQQRLALLEERSAIARELHDSLAQSLSYLKIQVARLRSGMRGASAGSGAGAVGGVGAGTPAVPVDEVLDELKGGLDTAYRQLRELLTTFRLRIDGDGLSSALRATVDEFTRRASLPIALDNRLADVELDANQQIHVLQTVREALANVERHARARNVQVRLARVAAGGEVLVTVEDDGVGIGDAVARTHHYGLAIMQDRAASLGGRCTVMPRPGGGTRVELRFSTDVAAEVVVA